jgi:hypothetical protein
MHERWSLLRFGYAFVLGLAQREDWAKGQKGKTSKESQQTNVRTLKLMKKISEKSAGRQ